MVIWVRGIDGRVAEVFRGKNIRKSVEGGDNKA